MNRMFKDCNLLTFINISSFRGTNVTTTKEMFSGCFSLTSLDLNNFDVSSATNMESMFYGCESLSYLNINNFHTSKVTNMKNMFRYCSSLISLNLSNFQIKENTQYEDIFFGISENLIYCMNNDFYEKIKSDMDNKKCSVWDNNCIPDWSKKSKKIINDNENGLCFENCNETENYKYEYKNKCYRSCPEGTTSMYNNNFLCEVFNDKEYKEFTDKQNKDIQICRPDGFFKHECKPKKYTNFMIDKIIHDIINGLINDVIDDIIKNKIDIYEIDDNIKYQITSSFNQKNNFYDNISVIDLQKCEDKLKAVYDIPQNETLIIFKYDYISDSYLVPIVGYEVFNPITKGILDLNHCKNIKIDIILPANISDDKLYKHDPHNNYFKDKCSTFPNEKGVDMTIYDRKKEYNDKNNALCLENCDYINYNNGTKKVVCQCESQFNLSLISWDKIINGKKLLHNFIDIKKSINIDVIKCFKKFMTKTGFKNNIGSYIILSIIIIYLVCLISFLVKGYKLLIGKINKIIKDNKKQNRSKNTLLITTNPPKTKNLILKTDRKSKKPRKYLTNSNNISSNSKYNLKKNSKNLKFKKRHETDKTNNKINSNNRAIYSDFELNLLDFSTAKKNDKRDYIEIYISFVKTRHPLISSFFPINDYNLMSIKICLLFFTLALNIFVTSLFFTDDTMHKIVEDEGLFNFLYNLPLTIYSTIISIIINIIIKKLALSEDTIIEIKKENKLEDMERLAKKKKKNLIIKFLLFFIFVFYYF